MPKRRRFATREELHELLVGCDPRIDWWAVFKALDEVGVRTELRIEVDEEV